MRLFYILTLLLYVGMVPAHGQETLPIPSEPPGWGEVSTEVLSVSDYPADSNASAVILSDYGDGWFQYGGDIEIERHTRVKILDEGGYESGTVTVPFHAESQEISGVEGVTYTLEEGTIREHELEGDDVFEEDVDGEYKQVRFSLPNLEPGAVIEYRYELKSESWLYIPSWSFQHAQPTLYSEYEIRVPGFLEYVALTTGTQDYDIVDEETRQTPRGRELEKRWVMKDVPALREEPFMTTPEDYRSRLEFQVKAVRNPRTGNIERFMNTWPDLAETLMDADTFGDDLGDGGGGFFGGEGAVEAQVERLTEGVSSDSAKMHAIYDYVRSSIEWDGETKQVRNQDFDEILESKTGNSAEVNLLLVSLLQNAGLEAHPVLISTRDHGKVFPMYPVFDQFNSVIAAVELPNQGGRALLDATDPHCPPSLLPVRDLNRHGWLVREEDPTWIELSTPTQTRRRIYGEATLQADGTLTGQFNVQDHGYTALETRKILRDEDASTFVRDHLLDELPEVSLSEVSVANQETLSSPLETTAKIESQGNVQKVEDMLYVNPRLMPSFTENPLKQNERTFPVDFGYPRETIYTLSLRLPDGYEVREVPETTRVTLPNGGGTFTRQIQVNENRLVVQSLLQINTPRVPPEEYQELRNLFTQVVSAQAEQVVLEAADAESDASVSPGENSSREK